MDEDIIKEHLKRWEPVVIEFLDEKDKLYHLTSSIEIVTDTYLILTAPKLGNVKYDLPVNSEVSLLFHRSEGILYALTTILGKQSSQDAKLKISTPYNVSLKERRRAKRYGIKLKLEVEYYLNKNAPNKKVVNTVTKDISSTGISFFSYTPFGKFHKITCNIYLDDKLSNPVQAYCQYVYSRQVTVKNETMYHIALEILEISKDDSIRLQQKCYRKTCI